MIKTLGLSSELLVMEGMCKVTDYGGYVVQETPSEPNYWVGNQLILRSASIDADMAEAQFAQHFPKAHHVAMVWDLPQIAPGDIDPGFVAKGWEVESFDVLALPGPIAQAAVPEGITIRAISGAQDWDQSLDLMLEIGVEDGHPKDSHRGFLARRNVSRRMQIDKGLGQWFGAFEGDHLVAQMGMFHDASVARYQSVETRASHRRRGICAALLRHCCLWALGRAPGAKPVIVAEADSDAGRLYRRMGFAPAEVLVGVLKPGYAAPKDA